MPSELCWYFEKEELRFTPSYFDGIDAAQEARYRRTGARFILCLGGELGMKHDACATAVVFFHRFYMFHSFKDMPLFVVAACCLFLAGKVEETPKKCHNIVKIALSLLPAEQAEQFHSNPVEEVMSMERVLLKTIRFDLQVQHPYKYLVQFAKRLRIENEQLNILVQTSWTFINDSLATALCLQWEPEIIACAVIYLSLKMKQMEIKEWEGRTSSVQRWWDCFVEGMTVEVMEDVCHQILDLYGEGNSDDATLFASAPKFTRNDGRGTHWRENANRIRVEHPEMLLSSRAMQQASGGFVDLAVSQSHAPLERNSFSANSMNNSSTNVHSALSNSGGVATLGYPVLNQSNQAALMVASSLSSALQGYCSGYNTDSMPMGNETNCGVIGYSSMNSSWNMSHSNDIGSNGPISYSSSSAYSSLSKPSHL